MKALLISAIGLSLMSATADAQSRSRYSPRDVRAVTSLALSPPIQFPPFTEEQKTLMIDPKNTPVPANRYVFDGLPPNLEPMDKMGFNRLTGYADRNRMLGFMWAKWVKWALDRNDKIEEAKALLSVMGKAEEYDLQRRSVEAQEAIARALRDQMVLGR